MKTIISTFLCLLLLHTACQAQTVWHPYSTNISFKIRNAALTVNGRFDTASVSLLFSTDKMSSSALSGTVRVNSIHTGIGKRDEHLKKEEYFDIDKYPTIDIKSVKLYYKGANYAGMFDVTIKGVTKQIEIPFDFIPLADEGEFKGSFTINRRDFKVGGSSMILGDDVTVDIDIKSKK